MSEQCQNSAQEICRTIYKDAKSFYGGISEAQKVDCGFQLLYGPPYFQTPILFLGYQPGRGTKSPLQERVDGSEERWPSRSEYVTETYPLAKRLQQVFDKEFLERCVGLNAIFIRSDSIKKYRRQFGSASRAEIKKFCLLSVKQIVDAIQPMRIVAIGFATLDLFNGSDEGKVSEQGRVLTRRGRIAGRDALGVLHLTGAWISNPDREIIANEMHVFTNLAAESLSTTCK